jgi:hypothetical protein
MRWVALLLVLATGCAASSALGVGATLDGQGHLGLEVEGADGPLPWDQGGLVSHVWSFGVEGSIGATRARPYVFGSLGVYAEYLDVGTMASPWGWHARLALGILGTIELTTGPTRLSSIVARDTNDGLTTSFVSNGVDTSVRWTFLPRFDGHDWRFDRNRWRFALRYERRWTLEYN